MRTHLIVAMGLVLSGIPAEAAAGATCVPSKLKQVAQRYAAAGFSGSVIVARDGAPLLRAAYGHANEEWTIQNTPQTKFRAGSLMKQFTAAAIMQLSEQGRLSLDDPASAHYPPWPPEWGSATIRQLLSHTSGIPNYSSRTDGTGGRVERQPDEIIDLVRRSPVRFAPGSRWEYNNTGYVVLGRIVELVSGLAFPAYLRTKILAPAGMKDSGYDDGNIVLANRAYGYMSTDGRLEVAPYLSLNYAYASGALYTTVDDLLRWDRALAGDRIVTARSKQQIFKTNVGGYGFGWFIGRRHNLIRTYHSGHINGFSSFFARTPEAGVAIAVLSNRHSSDAPERLTAELEAILDSGSGPSDC